MTHNLTNIDVTLRDGGYRNGFNFSPEYAIKHASLSAAAGFNWIEVGYRKGSFNQSTSKGLTGQSDDRYISSIADAVGEQRVGIMVHPRNISVDDLKLSYDSGARLVRICLPPDIADGLRCVEQAKEIGFKVCANVTRVSAMLAKQISSISSEVRDAGADVLYLADSNGSLNPTGIETLVTAARMGGVQEIGVHTHNHLGLAISNAIAGVGAGASWVDSAILGMGKGAGNLIAEQWFAYTTQWRHVKNQFNLARLLELSNALRAHVAESAPRIDTTDILLGYFDLPVEHGAKLSLINDHEGQVETARHLSRSIP